MLKCYDGYVAARGGEGDRTAFLVDKRDFSIIKKTYFIFDEEYEADDDDIEDENEEQAVENAKQSNEVVVPESLVFAMKLGTFNLELFRRVVNTKKLDLLQLADPPSQVPAMLFGLQQMKIDREQDNTTQHVNDSVTEPDLLQGAELHLPSSGNDVLVPASSDSTFRFAVPGPTGVGKSVWVGQYCKIYRVEHPWIASREKKRKRDDELHEDEDDEDEEDEHSHARRTKSINYRINVFTFFEHDKAYDGIDGLFYIKLDKDLLTSGRLSQDLFKNSLCIFDDVEALTGALKEVVIEFRDQCLKTGRKKEISTISVIHEMFGGIETRPTWKESEGVVVFPRADTKNIENLLKGKYGMPKAEIAYVINQKTRAVFLKRTHPRALITRTKIKVMT